VSTDLVALERRFWHEAGDVAFYRANALASVVMVFPAPFGIMAGDALFDAVAGAQPWADVEFSDVHVDEHVDGVATVAYHALASHRDGAPYTTYASSVYVRTPDGWKLALHQQTPIA